LQPGDHISFLDEQGSRQLLTILGRKRAGYRVRLFGTEEDDDDEDLPKELSDVALNKLILSRDYVHHPCDVSRIEERHRHLLFKEWEHFSPKAVFEAREYRAVIVAAVDRARPSFSCNRDCIEAVLEELWNSHLERWTARESDIVAEERRAKRTNARDPIDPNPPRRVLKQRTKPHWRTVLQWLTLWRIGGKDPRILLPLYDQRGNRDPRLSPRVYELMEVVTRTLWLKPPKKTMTSVHGALEDLCLAEDEETPHRTSLYRFIRGYVKARDEDKAIYGWRSAFLRYTAHPPTQSPSKPLEQVEIDHCLLDVYVRDERTGKLLGRPWLTAIIDRLTRVICGIHLSWEFPSYASVQRALAHAMWPKDLTPFADLKNDWPVCGVPDIIITDQGREMKSISLAEAEQSMHFEVVRLKRKRPWLKGRIERAFKTIHIQVFSHKEGAIVYKGIRDLDHYNPQKSTELTLGDLRRDLLKWIVDEYHQTPHSSLRAPGTGLKEAPIDAWKREVAIHRVRPPRSWSEIIQLIGTATTRTIQKPGVKLFGLTYWDRRLNNLLARRGGKEMRWPIRVDPFDIGRLWLFDNHPTEGGWLQIQCTRQDLSDGVSIYQHREHRRLAYKNKRGGNLTEAAILKAKQKREEQFRKVMSEVTSVASATREARYGHRNGAYFTPLMGMSAREIAEGIAVVQPGLMQSEDRCAIPLPNQADDACHELIVANDPDPAKDASGHVTSSAEPFDLEGLLAASGNWRVS
jgi:putative transposase